ncbi:MAG: CDP-alcohol phosphatidyltransferase family protein [Alphaproteobacteria bacterium TMED89]|nr:MAG: CDP-alcohol phosphatidyltransferase family protein [Alphaproteobacteria bacterium TMED89]
MIDAQLRRFTDPPADRFASWFVARGINADQVTLVGFFIGLLAVPTLWLGWPLLALLLIAVNRVADGIDGAIARQTEATDRGGFLDICLDFFFYSAIPLGFALMDPSRNALAACFLIFSFVGSGTSFLAFAVLAEKRGQSTDIRGQKSFYYLGGLTEGFETVVFLVLVCLFHGAFWWLALIFGFMAWITAVTRLIAGWQQFR